MLKKERLDLVCILVPAAYHREIAVQVAKHCANILIEKPISISLSDSEEIIEECKKNSVKLFYGASFRYFPACIKAKELLAAKLIGNIMLMFESVIGGRGIDRYESLGSLHYPHGGIGNGGLGLVDHGIHLVDLFRWFSDSEIVKVSGKGNYSGEPPSTELMTMYFENGAVGQLIYNEATISSNLPQEGIFSLGSGWAWDGSVFPENTWQTDPQNIRIHGEYGSLRIFPYANKLYHCSIEGVKEIPLNEKSSCPMNLTLQMKAVVNAIIGGEDPKVTGIDGYKALQAIHSTYESYNDK